MPSVPGICLLLKSGGWLRLRRECRRVLDSDYVSRTDMPYRDGVTSSEVGFANAALRACSQGWQQRRGEWVWEAPPGV